MLQILQTKHIENYAEKLCEMNLLQLFPNVVEAEDNGNVIGYGIYHFENSTVVLDEVNSEGDLYLYDGIVRAVLFLAVMKGYDVAEFRFSDKENARKLGFIKNDDNVLSGLNEFMSKCKSCGK